MQRRKKLLVIVEGRNGAGRDRPIKRDRKYIERWVLLASEIGSSVASEGLPHGSAVRAWVSHMAALVPVRRLELPKNPLQAWCAAYADEGLGSS